MTNEKASHKVTQLSSREEMDDGDKLLGGMTGLPGLDKLMQSVLDKTGDESELDSMPDFAGMLGELFGN